MAGRKPKARYLQVRGWWSFQQYPDKVEAGWTPPWVKNYTALLDDYEYNSLSEIDRGRLHRIWLLAARLNNKIPWDERFIRTAIRAAPSFHLEPFIHSGMLLEWDENATIRPVKRPSKRLKQAVSALDGVYAASMPEQNRTEERREEPTEPVADDRGGQRLDQLQAAARLYEAIPPVDRDEGTERIVLGYANLVSVDELDAIRLALVRKLGDDALFKTAGAYVNGALQKAARKPRAAA